MYCRSALQCIQWLLQSVSTLDASCCFFIISSSTSFRLVQRWKYTTRDNIKSVFGGHRPASTISKPNSRQAFIQTPWVWWKNTIIDAVFLQYLLCKKFATHATKSFQLLGSLGCLAPRPLCSWTPPRAQPPEPKLPPNVYYFGNTVGVYSGTLENFQAPIGYIGRIARLSLR